MKRTRFWSAAALTVAAIVVWTLAAAAGEVRAAPPGGQFQVAGVPVSIHFDPVQIGTGTTAGSTTTVIIYFETDAPEEITLEWDVDADDFADWEDVLKNAPQKFHVNKFERIGSRRYFQFELDVLQSVVNGGKRAEIELTVGNKSEEAKLVVNPGT